MSEPPPKTVNGRNVEDDETKKDSKGLPPEVERSVESF